MSLYGAFDSTKHFDELNDPLPTQEGVLTPSQRRARAFANLFGIDEEDLGDPGIDTDFTISGDFTANNVIAETAITSPAGTIGALDGDTLALTELLSVQGVNEDDTVVAQIGYGLQIKRFHDIITVDTAGATTAVGLTPDATILSAGVRVSTAIAGLDSADHTLALGVSGTTDKYIEVANGSAATSIAENVKASYIFDPSLGVEDAALILTIGGGSDNTPSAGAVEVEVLYMTSVELADG